VIDGEDVRVQPGLVPTNCWRIHHDSLSAIPKVNDIFLPLEVVGGVVDGENWVLVEGVVLDEYLFGAVCVGE
jgi:hypothetical protein